MKAIQNTHTKLKYTILDQRWATTGECAHRPVRRLRDRGLRPTRRCTRRVLGPRTGRRTSIQVIQRLLASFLSFCLLLGALPASGRGGQGGQGSTAQVVRAQRVQDAADRPVRAIRSGWSGWSGQLANSSRERNEKDQMLRQGVSLESGSLRPTQTVGATKVGTLNTPVEIRHNQWKIRHNRWKIRHNQWKIRHSSGNKA